MIKKIFFALFIVLFTTSSNSEVINKIIIEGNKRVSDETIKVYGDIQIKKDISENDVNKIISNLYSTNFFEEVEIELSQNILTIQVKEYPVVNQLTIIGEKNNGYVEQIKSLFNLVIEKHLINLICLKILIL